MANKRNDSGYFWVDKALTWQIKQDIVELVENELIRIENDPKLKYLLGDNENNNS